MKKIFGLLIATAFIILAIFAATLMPMAAIAFMAMGAGLLLITVPRLRTYLARGPAILVASLRGLTALTLTAIFVAWHRMITGIALHHRLQSTTFMIARRVLAPITTIRAVNLPWRPGHAPISLALIPS